MIIEEKKEIIQQEIQLIEIGKSLNKEQMRAFITDLENKMLEGDPYEFQMKHHFSKKVYAREMFIPKGLLVVGKIHKFQNLNIISSGEVSVLSIDGVFRLMAPHTFVASPGTKRVIYAHQDTVWTTIHGTDETDLEKIEEEFIAKNYGEIIELEEMYKKNLEV